MGAEGAVLARQVARFQRLHPEISVRIQRTPDDATQRHQMFVQWLNARVGDPDLLQLDVVWTAEFAAAGWILPLDRFDPDSGFFPATLTAAEWNGHLDALPWFADVGLLYRRTDLVPNAPESLEQLAAAAARTSGAADQPQWGLVWQGARYEGLVTVFLEYLGGFGGRIMDDSGRVVVDSPAGIAALRFMRDELTPPKAIAPLDVLTWHEEESRFAFQNGRAVFMRNWPYAYPLMNDSAESRVAGRFAVSTMPGAPGGHPTAALGGSELAINAFTEHPREAYALAAYLTAPAQMLERAEMTGQFPTRPALYDDPRLAAALPIPVDQVRQAIAHATARPVTPVYTELSGILQIALHDALSGQSAPAAALHDAARKMTAVLVRSGLAHGGPG